MATKKNPAAKKPRRKPAALNAGNTSNETAEPFTDTAVERCGFLDGLKKIVDLVGNVIEDIPQAWRHGDAVETAPHE